MMFAVARELPAANASTHAGKWEKYRFMGVELTGKTLGVIGAAISAPSSAPRARAEDAGDGLRPVPRRTARSSSAWRRSSSTSCSRADFITLHMPLTDQTRNILEPGRHRQAQARRADRQLRAGWSRGRGGARGEALTDGRVAGAAFDVFAVEPATESPLFNLPNVVVTPHLGAATAEAQENVALQVAEQMADYLLTGAVSNALNMPSITAEEAPRLKPFVKLAEVLGAFVGQVTEEPIKEVEILFDGSTAGMNTRALISAALAGLIRRPGGRRQHGLGAGLGQGARHPAWRRRGAARRAPIDELRPA